VPGRSGHRPTRSGLNRRGQHGASRRPGRMDGYRRHGRGRMGRTYAGVHAPVRAIGRHGVEQPGNGGRERPLPYGTDRSRVPSQAAAKLARRAPIRRSPFKNRIGKHAQRQFGLPCRPEIVNWPSSGADRSKGLTDPGSCWTGAAGRAATAHGRHRHLPHYGLNGSSRARRAAMAAGSSGPPSGVATYPKREGASK
jgi:hypothetical protein